MATIHLEVREEQRVEGRKGRKKEGWKGGRKREEEKGGCRTMEEGEGGKEISQALKYFLCGRPHVKCFTHVM